MSYALFLELQQYKPKLQLFPSKKRLHGISNTPLRVHGLVTLDVEVAHQFVLVQFTVVDHCADEAVLGMDFLAANGTSWDWDNGELAFRGGPMVFAQPKDMDPNSPTDKAHRVRLSEQTVLPSNMITMVKVAWR
jgi:hypothetical protein